MVVTLPKASENKYLHALRLSVRFDEHKPFFKAVHAFKPFLKSAHLFLSEFHAGFVDRGHELYYGFDVFE